ncbi:MAG: hypothetical protein AB8B74_14575 [Crocinitomicaceae bacterium]
MTSFFTIIYIKTNQLSDERIAVGLLANINGIPEFHYSNDKLNFALKAVNSNLLRPIKISLQRLKSDVNKYVNGETSVPMFDEPYSKKMLQKLVLKKRGVLYYGDLIEINKAVKYEVLYRKYISKVYVPLKHATKKKETFKRRFNQHISHKRYDSFVRKQWISDTDFPLLSAPVQVDLIRQTSGFTVFKSLDFSLSENKIQQHIATFRMLVESLSIYSQKNGLSKGRYYLVFESPKSESKMQLTIKVKSIYSAFELIKMSEIADKI